MAIDAARPPAAPARIDPSQSTRWADVAVVAMALVVGVLLAATPLTSAQVAIGATSVVALVVTWIVIRRRLEVGLGGTVARTLVLAAIGFGCTLAAPWLAITQALLHPLVWLGAGRRRYGVLGSLVLCIAVAAGWIVRDPADWWAALATQAGSWAFSVWFGLWIGAIDRLSTERGELVAALQATRDEVAALAAEQGARRERDRIAREIHDTIAQDLAGVVMLLEGARGAAEGSSAAALERAEHAARSSLADARALVAGEIDVVVDARGLAATLSDVAERVARDSALALVTRIDAAVLDREAQVVLVRSLQEALSNVRRHARAQRVHVSLEVEPHAAVLRVDDDGVGLPDVRPATAGFGLDAMARRAALVGGTATTSGSPLGGARVEVRIPTSHATSEERA